MSIAWSVSILVFAFVLAACTSGPVRTGAAIGPGEPWRISPANSKATEPAAAAAPDGGAYLAYVEHGADGSDIYLQRVDPGGRPRGERVPVNNEPGRAKTWGGDPPTLAVGPASSVYVGWTRKYADPKSKGTDLMLSVSRDGGGTFEPAVKVNDDLEPASHGMHSLALGADGRVIMAWLDERNVGKPEIAAAKTTAGTEETEPNSEVFAAVSTDGGKTFSANRKLAAEVCPCCKTSLLVDEGGTVYLSWRQVLEDDHRHMAVASSTDGGLSFAPGVVVSDDQWQLSACPMSGAALASPGRDQLEVNWYTAGDAGVAGLYSARSNDGGKSFGPRRLLSGVATAGTPAITPRFYLFNSTDGSVIARPADMSPDGAKAFEIREAALPTVAAMKDRTFVAFVRVKGKSGSVWASTLPN